MHKQSWRKLLVIFLSMIFTTTFDSCSNGQFEQIGYYKKALANGANFRVFSVYVNEFKDTSDVWSKIEDYARLKMYTPGGTTMVFFFKDRNMTPDVTFVGENFDKKYEIYCVAGYWKYPNGKEKFAKYPFKYKQ